MFAAARSYALLAILWFAISSPEVAFSQAPSSRSVVIVSDGARQAAGFDPADSSGLFVGIRQFRDAELTAVPYAVDDAVDLAHLFVFDLELIHAGKVILALAGSAQKPASRRRLKELIDAGARTQEAGRSDLFRLLGKQALASGPSGLFITTVATHGFSKEGQDSLVTWDAVRADLAKTGFLVADLLEKVAEARAPRRLVLIDACRERLTSSRSLGGHERNALGRSFVEAIEQAQGQVVLAAATENGFAYDDRERKNGVFTVAIIDGLRGGAMADSRGFITAETLADFAQERVLSWIGRHRREDLGRSRGITRTLEGPAATLPLAIVRNSSLSLEERTKLAVDRLEREVGDVITPRMVKDLRRLIKESEREEILLWLEQIEELDGSPTPQRSLAWSYAQLNAPTDLQASDWEITRKGIPETSSQMQPRGTLLESKVETSLSNSEDFLEIGDVERAGGGAIWEDPHLGIRFHSVLSELAEPDRLEQGEAIPSFWMGETEVTQQQWQVVMGTKVARFDECGKRCPVESVTWYEAITFANELSKASGLEPCYELSGMSGALGSNLKYDSIEPNELCTGYRLPTYAEWKFAAGGARGRSDSANQDRDVLASLAWYAANSEVAYRSGSDCPWIANRGSGGFETKCGTHPVGMLKPNRWGIRDLLGNVSEWCWDLASSVSPIDPTRPDSSEEDRSLDRVVCGASWSSHEIFVHPAHGSSSPAGRGDATIGFRLVKDSVEEVIVPHKKNFKKPRIKVH